MDFSSSNQLRFIKSLTLQPRAFQPESHWDGGGFGDPDVVPERQGIREIAREADG
jgi:hypothetical protein